jgi:hypothetical protein
MEVPVPSLENIKAAWAWAIDQLDIWFQVIRDPVATLSAIDLDSPKETIKAIQFAVFPLMLGPLLMIPIPLFVPDVGSSLGIVGYFIVNVILNVLGAYIASVGQRLGAKVLRGKGLFNARAISTLYGMAFWPVMVLNVYIGANHHDVYRKLDAQIGLTASDYLTPLTDVIGFLVVGAFLLSKYVPMTRYVHKVGRFRAFCICLFTIAVSAVVMLAMISSFVLI